MAEDSYVHIEGLKRYFDVSAPWLVRKLERRPRQIVQAVDGIDIEIAKGETFSLVGESGCGKSTVARLVVGLYPPTAGRIEFDGNDMATRRGQADHSTLRRRMQMIFQDPFASLNPRWRVFDIIAEPIRAFGLSRDKADLEKQVGDLLEQVKLTPADGRKYPHEFSGGQRQRISIARALASRPEFLVCDEPTSALDVSVQAAILNLLGELQARENVSYVFISHDLGVVRYLSDRIAVLYLGRLMELGPAELVFDVPHHPYTEALLSAVATIDGEKERIRLVGEIPSAANPPTGCVFHTRCPRYLGAICDEQEPPLVEVAPDHAMRCHIPLEELRRLQTAGPPPPRAPATA
jgi:peptide/nickel transport system ATP-binding protein